MVWDNSRDGGWFIDYWYIGKSSNIGEINKVNNVNEVLYNKVSQLYYFKIYLVFLLF